MFLFNEITLKANDRSGLIVEITNAIGESRIPLRAINAKNFKGYVGSDANDT